MSTQASSPVTIVWVTGAWHTTKSYRPLGDILSKSGYKNVYVEHLSVGCAKPLEDPTADVKQLHRIITEVVESGSDVVVVCHSYGGVVTACASEDLGKKDREAKGLKNGIINLIYLSAFVLPLGMTLQNATNNKPETWMILRDDGLRGVKNPEQVFYHDCSPEDVKTYVEDLKLHSGNVFAGVKITYEGYKHIPSSYLICDDDQALPRHVQEMMIEGAGKGAFQIVEHIKASHSPFISMPKETAAFIERVAKASV